MKRYPVLFTEGAERDLEELYDHVAASDSPLRADHLLDRLLTLVEALATQPGRGAVPRELAALGLREYRQVLFKPYRVIYRVLDAKVYVYLVVDGRRDLGALLSRRLLGG